MTEPTRAGAPRLDLAAGSASRRVGDVSRPSVNAWTIDVAERHLAISARRCSMRRVHAAVADQPDQVHALVVAQRGLQHLVVEQRAVLDRLVDPREVLLDDRAGAEVEVADLGVAHLALGQPDGARRTRSACVCG